MCPRIREAVDTAPFASFSANVFIYGHIHAFAVNSAFTLGSGASIDPAKQDVTFTLTSQSSSYSTTIPAGKFQTYDTRHGTVFYFSGTVDGVGLVALISPPIPGFTTSYSFNIAGIPIPEAPPPNLTSLCQIR